MPHRRSLVCNACGFALPFVSHWTDPKSPSHRPGSGHVPLAPGWTQAGGFFLLTGFPSMQLEAAMLILFSAIWPLAGLKYDSINYCQENPGVKSSSRRMLRGAPGVVFPPHAMGYGVRFFPSHPFWGFSCHFHPLARLPAALCLMPPVTQARRSPLRLNPGPRGWHRAPWGQGTASQSNAGSSAGETQ